MRTDHLDPALLEPQSQSAAVGGLVLDHPSRLRPQKATDGLPHGYLLERRVDKRDFRRGRWGKAYLESNTLAVRHEHAVCPVSASGFADIGAPLFARGKVLSLNVLSEDKEPSLSRFQGNVLQWKLLKGSSSTSESCRCSQRQDVKSHRICAARSFQRAPVRSAHRILNAAALLDARASALLQRPVLQVPKPGCGSCWSVTSDA